MAQNEPGFSVQDVVYNLDVGMGLQILRILLYIGIVLVLMLLYTASQFKGLKSESAMDSAQIARNIAYGRGYTTRNISPMSMKFVQSVSPDRNPRIQNHPELIKPPVYPALLSAFFRVGRGAVQPYEGRGTYPPEQYFIIPVNNILMLITGFLVFLLGRRLFDRRLGFLAMTTFYLSNVVWASSISGTSLPLVMFLAVAGFYATLLTVDFRESGAPFWRWFLPFLFACGFAVLAFLTRYGAIFLLPAFALYIGVNFSSRRWTWIAVFIGLFLLGIAPWIARNLMVCGKPLGLAPYMLLNGSGNAFLANYEPSFSMGQFFRRSVFRNWMENITSFYNADIRQIGSGFLGAFFVTSFFYSFVRKDVRNLRWAVALGIMVLVVIAGFYGKETIELLKIFLPFVIIYGLAFFFLLLERLQLQFRVLEIGLISFVIAMSALPLVFKLLPPRAGVPYPPYYPPFISYVTSLMEPGELLTTDMPWATAWYGDQKSLHLPEDIDDFYAINDYTYNISGLYFTTLTRDKPYIRTLKTGPYKSWFPVLEGRIPEDFPLTAGFPMNNLDQLFLTDYKRWEEKPDV